jgi:hypothetical protein
MGSGGHRPQTTGFLIDPGNRSARATASLCEPSDRDCSSKTQPAGVVCPSAMADGANALSRGGFVVRESGAGR